MKLTLFTFGTYGDVRPFVALGRALQVNAYDDSKIRAQHPGKLIQEEDGVSTAVMAVDAILS